MKIVYILLGLVVIGGILFVLSGDKNEVAAPTTNEVNELNDVVEESEGAVAEEVVSEDDEQEMMTEETTEPETQATERVFTLDSFSYGYSETEIRVKQGDTVTINLTNSDGFHDWVVDEFSAATEKIRAGDQTSVTFVADKAGTFEFYCSVGNHRAQGMVGKLIVE